jgi:hypothetical protein
VYNDFIGIPDAVRNLPDRSFCAPAGGSLDFFWAVLFFLIRSGLPDLVEPGIGLSPLSAKKYI